jgi:hypothetical protein
MQEIKDKLNKIGYTTVVESEAGISLVNENLSTCVIILDVYDPEQLYGDSELREPMEKKYSFAEKGTICVFSKAPEGLTIEEIERDEYHALKLHESHIDCIPSRKEDITIIFEPVKTLNEYNNSILNEEVAYVIDPFSKVDGLMSQGFYRYLANAKDGDIVKYPLIISGMTVSWLRYITQKFYKQELRS